MRVKTCPAKIKAAGPQDGSDDGVFEALVATYELDSVGDKITPGAFQSTLDHWKAAGDPIPVLWSHMSHDPDYHIGYVEEAEERPEGLWVRARIDLDEPKSAKVYKLLKGKRVRQFSFAYDVLDGGWVQEKDADESHYELRQLALYEVSPTLIGANQETELLAVKAAIQSHSTATSDEEWDGPANEANLPGNAGAATYRQAYAWQDPNADPDTKAAWKFIHHHVDADGNVGAASTGACTSGIAVLNGGRTGTTIPDGDREAVYNHLAAHLRDADQHPPELKSIQDLRTADTPSHQKAGRALSAKNEDALTDALDKIADGTASIKAVLADLHGTTETEEPDDEGKATPAAPPANPTSKTAPESPARPGTASIRLRRDLDLLAVEVDQLTY